MQQPPFSFDEHEPPLAPAAWKIKSALALESDPAILRLLKDQLLARSSGDLECVATADDALDLIGAVSAPFDMILLGSDDQLGHSAHVISILRKHRTPSVVFAISNGAIPDNASWPWFVGIADWLNLKHGRQWPRRVAQALDAGVTLGSVLGRVRTPWHMEPSVARRIYGAAPGTPFIVPQNE